MEVHLQSQEFKTVLIKCCISGFYMSFHLSTKKKRRKFQEFSLH